MLRFTRFMVALSTLSVVVLLSVASVAPVAAQVWTEVESIGNAQELAEYQMHLVDSQVPVSEMEDGAISDLNELAQVRAEEAGMLGVVPAPQLVPWYVEFAQICDCGQLAHYQSHLADINALPGGY